MAKDLHFVDYYDLLGISPQADLGLINLAYRYRVKAAHPDSPETGDAGLFALIVQAYQTLKNPEKRAEYDRLYASQGRRTQQGLSDESACEVASDVDIQQRLLGILYEKRRADTRNPAMGDMRLLEQLQCSQSHLDFLIWYLKEKGLIRVVETGGVAITVDGVDQIVGQHMRKIEQLQLTDRRAYA